MSPVNRQLTHPSSGLRSKLPDVSGQAAVQHPNPKSQGMHCDLRLARPGRLHRLRASPRLAPSPLVLPPVPAQVRICMPTLPTEPPAACFARLPAVVSALPATQSQWRLPSAGFPGVDSPFAFCRSIGRPDRRGGFGFHTRRTDGALPTFARHRVIWRNQPYLQSLTARTVPPRHATSLEKRRRGCFLYDRPAARPEQGAATMNEKSTFARARPRRQTPRHEIRNPRRHGDRPRPRRATERHAHLRLQPA